MQHFEVIIVVFAILIVLLALANKMRITNPILLVVAGLALGFIPSLPAVVLDPQVVFLLFLPPILYDAATRTSWHDFKLEIRPISRLAIALVFLTTMTVAITCYFFIPGFTWPLAFVLGAIVSPPDAVATTSITKGLGLNKRVVTILQGESLVNDASALIAYRFAISAVGTGVFVFWKASLGFLILAAGGVLAGLAVGYVVINIHKRIRDNSIISTSLTLLTPFISYLAAEHVYSSGVLAVVTTGLMISWRAPEIFTYHTRIRNSAVWDTVIFLLNAFIFILIGLQLPLILEDLTGYATADLIIYGLLVSGVTIVVRVVWIFGAAYIPIGRKRKNYDGTGEPDTWKNVLIMAWSGSRGVVSLATALAMPLMLSNGDAFPQRSLILFLAFVVILITLVIQGLSLPILIKLLGVKSDEVDIDDEVKLRLLMATRVIDYVDNDLSDTLSKEVITQIKSRYLEVVGFLTNESQSQTKGEAKAKKSTISSQLYQVKSKINTLQRDLLISFHKDGSYNQSTIRELERELDHEEQELHKNPTILNIQPSSQPK